MAFGDEFLNRFGPYRLQPYDVPLYNGGAVGGVPGGGTIGVPGPAPTPTPAPTPMPTPRPGGGNNGGNTGGGSGSGPGGRGNEGGASHGVGGGGAGDNAGHPGANAAPASAGAGSSGFDGGLFGGGMFNFGPNQGINLGPWGAGALQAAATLAPFPYSLAPTLLQTALRGFNTANADAVRTSLGAPALDAGQVIGAMLGLNDYGSLSGNQTFINREQNTNPITGKPVAVTQGGYYDPGFLQRLFTGDVAGTAYTPEEKRLRDLAAAGLNSGNAAGGDPAGGNAGAIHSTTMAGDKPTSDAQYDVASGTWGGSSAASFSYDHPVYGGGKEGGLIGYRQKNGSISMGPAGNGPGSFQGVAGGGFSDRAGTMTSNGPLGAFGNPLGAGGSNQNGGMMARGGYVRGRPDRIPDNHTIHANEGEFVMRNSAAAAAGPALLGLINTPAGARRVRAILGL